MTINTGPTPGDGAAPDRAGNTGPTPGSGAIRLHGGSEQTGPRDTVRRLLLATTNAGKARELAALLAETGWECVTPRGIGLAPVEVIESARSYLENAVGKAVAHARASGLPTLADDSGLEVDALAGAPGVISARFGGPSARTDAERTALLLRRLEGVPRARRGARFRAIVAIALPGGRTFVREGILEGRITSEPRGASGFGYDPVFELPDGRTLAEVGEEKQEISHRSIAVRAMIEVLNSLEAPR